MGMDDSFKKAGAVPFKWEIKPGVPKQQQQQHQHNDSPPSLEFPSPKLRPPPWTRSFKSTPLVRSDRWQLDRPFLASTDSVPSGCFFSPLLRRLLGLKMGRKPTVEPDYVSDLEIVSWWSMSSRKSLNSSMSSSSTWVGLGPLF